MKRNLLKKEEDSDPISVVSNLFDVAMVFAVALMVALVTRYNMTEMLSQEDFTMVKNPGKENMEIITKEGEKINRYTPSEDQQQSGTRGKHDGKNKKDACFSHNISVQTILRTFPAKRIRALPP